MIGGLYVDRRGRFSASRALVDHREPRVDRGAMPREDLAVDGGGKHHIGARSDPLKRRLEGVRGGAEALARDDDKAPTRREARQGGQDMLAGGLPEPTLDMVRRGEGRVHHDDRGRDRAIQTIVDRGRIMAADDGLREQQSQQGAAGFREFIQR